MYNHSVFIHLLPQSEWGLRGDRAGTVGTGQKTRNGGFWGLGDRNGDYSFEKLCSFNMLCLRSPVPTVPYAIFQNWDIGGDRVFMDLGQLITESIRRSVREAVQEAMQHRGFVVKTAAAGPARPAGKA